MLQLYVIKTENYDCVRESKKKVISNLYYPYYDHYPPPHYYHYYDYHCYHHNQCYYSA